ncbi:hypothetical protein AJ79_05271 [Helicocarpus griseus UAMH5409]|uniref:Structural maintenance of chromosomes protein 5 n=1 Tax=Helicocarpus griseus UAMH5409 TaxID=1447875 RepID=A0A2B7XQB9_9EURO|nr:hypothetical protein AJ79_05271 [Helicocarpus griseus UAMH5409]
MPSIAPLTQRRRRRADNSETDNDNDDETTSRISRDGTPFSQTSNGSKRIRLSTFGDGENDDNDASGTLDEESEDGPPSNTLHPSTAEARPVNGKQGSSLGNGISGNASSPVEHRPGSIVRVKLTDFVTYTSAEFFPGPRLNMVIGPNGTGKSTLVCAICLGLGWGPQHLGRAKDPAEFVKHGCREATIEIELAGGRKHRQNPVIRRTIVRKDNKSTFTINGKPSPKARVLELAQSFSIQIDNLCQFLPQDKVAEFAALSPIELLHSTQRAAAGPEMLEWHENLKTLRAEQKKLQATYADDREQLANLENRQEMQRADVERMRQRAQIQKKIALLERSRPMPRYKEARRHLKETVQKGRSLQQEAEDLENQLNPTLASLNEKKDYSKELRAVVAQKKGLAATQQNVADEIVQKLDKAQADMRDLDAQIEAERKAATMHRDNHKKTQHAVNKIKRQMEEEPVEFDAAAFTEKIRDCVRQIRDIEEQSRNLQEIKKETFRDYHITKGKIEKENERLENLESESGRQEQKLRMFSPDTAKAWDWIKENQSKFQQKVYGPPIVECSIKDPAYANAMESLFSRNDLLTFTAQCRDDFKLLQKVLSQEMRLHDITLKVSSSVTQAALGSPMSDEQLRALGFECWAKDQLCGPGPVTALLCSENRLNQTPIARRDITDDDYERVTKTLISSWVSGSQSYQIVRRREYGPSAISTRVRQLKPARFWTNQPVDVSARNSIENNVRDLRRELDLLQGRLDEQKTSLENFKHQHGDAQRVKGELEQEKAAKQTALMNYKALPTKLAQQEEKLRVSHAGMDDFRKRVAELRDKQDKIALEQASVALEYANCVDEFQRLVEDLVLAEIRLHEATSDVKALEERNKEVRRILDDKRAEVEEAIKESATARAEYDKFEKDLQAFIKYLHEESGMDSEELKEFLETMKGHSTDQLEADIDSEKAALELAGEGNSNVIREFEHRQHRIDKLKDQLAEFHRNLAELDDAIAEVRGKWEPKLDALVQKISDAFSDSFARIGCAGQVSVDKAEDVPEYDNGIDSSTQADNDSRRSTTSDFDQWSIRIQVKFREHESLSVLDSHRQSGGERAVSTIFYLMALQSLSASPLRVVDEINQGMDPRNERMVHERMVDIACASDDGARGGGQYFLITPKLLSGLVYKRGMKVLCIVSGEYVPEEYEKIDFGKCVSRIKGAMRAGGKGKRREIDRGRVEEMDVGA